MWFFSDWQHRTDEWSGEKTLPTVTYKSGREVPFTAAWLPYQWLHPGESLDTFRWVSWSYSELLHQTKHVLLIISKLRISRTQFLPACVHSSVKEKENALNVSCCTLKNKSPYCLLALTVNTLYEFSPFCNLVKDCFRINWYKLRIKRLRQGASKIYLKKKLHSGEGVLATLQSWEHSTS